MSEGLLDTRPESEAAAEADGWRRLSPRMLFLHPVHELVRQLPTLLAAFVAGRSAGHGEIWPTVVGVLAVASGPLRWYTTTYRIGPDLVELRHGILMRKRSSVPTDRVRTVDLTANAAHRALGLIKVTVGTGRPGGQERDGLKLDAMRRAEALSLRDALLGAARAAGADLSGADGQELLRLDPRWIRYSPFSLNGFVSLIFLGLALSHAESGLLGLGPVAQVKAWIWSAGLVTRALRVSVAVLGAATVINVFTYLVKSWNFRLVRQPAGTLELTHGLLTRRAVTLEERRIRGVEVTEGLLLRSVGGARCTAIATGLRTELGGPLLAPAAPARTVLAVADQVLGTAVPLTAALATPGAGARARRLSRALLGWAAVALGLVVLRACSLVPLWCCVAWPAALPAAWLLARDRYRALGHAVSEGFLVVRSGSLLKRRAVLACDGVIGWNLRRSWTQRRAGLVTLTATTAAGRKKYPVRDLADGQAVLLAEDVVPGLLTPFLAEQEQE